MKNAKLKKQAADKPVARPVQNRAILSRGTMVESREPDFTKRRPGVFSRAILPAFVILHFAFCISAQATITVTGLVSQITSAALDTKIMFTPAADILLLTNGLSVGPAKTITSTNGAFSTPLNPGTYLVRLPLVGGRNAFTIGVPHGTGSENITNLIGAPWTYQEFLNTMGTGISSSAATNIAAYQAYLSTNTLYASIAAAWVAADTVVSNGLYLLIASGATLDPRFTSSPDTISAGSNTFSATTITASTIQGTTLSGAGSGITLLNASQLASGTVPEARSAKTLTNVTLRGDTVFEATTWGIAGDGSASFNLVTATNFYGGGVGLTGVPTNSIDATFYAWVLSQSSTGAGDLLAVNNLADVASTGQARTNIAAHNASNLSIGTVADARIASTIARDTEVEAAGTVVSNGVVAVAIAALGAADTVVSNGVVAFAVGRDAELVNKTNVAWPLLQTQRRLQTRAPLRAVYLGDSVGFEPYLLGDIMALSMKRNGTIFQTGLTWSYYSTNGNGTLIPAGTDDGIWPASHYNMNSSSVLTWQSSVSNGYAANAIELYYWKLAAFSTLTVQTQAYGGSWATHATVDAASGATLTAAYTNWILPAVIPNLQVRVTSSGSNIVWALGHWDTNIDAGFRQSVVYAPNVDITAYPSNTLQTFLAGMQPDLLMINFKDDATETSNALVRVEGVMGVIGTNTDLVYLSPTMGQESSTIANRMAQRRMMLALAETYQRPFYDQAAWFLPWNSTTTNYFYNDGAHLNAAGQTFLATKLAPLVGVNPEALSLYGYPASSLYLTNNYDPAVTFQNSLTLNTDGADIMIGGVPADPNNYAGWWFVDQISNAGFTNMALGAQAGGVNWANALTSYSIRVNNGVQMGFDGSRITVPSGINFSGTNIESATINSNRFDAATLAKLYEASGGTSLSNITESGTAAYVSDSLTVSNMLLLGTNLPSKATFYQDEARFPNAPVTVLRPLKTNSAMVLDLMPSTKNGLSASNYSGTGNTWIDLVDRDITDPSVVQGDWAVARLAMQASGTSNGVGSVHLGGYSGGNVPVPTVNLNFSQLWLNQAGTLVGLVYQSNLLWGFNPAGNQPVSSRLALGRDGSIGMDGVLTLTNNGNGLAIGSNSISALGANQSLQLRSSGTGTVNITNKLGINTTNPAFSLSFGTSLLDSGSKLALYEFNGSVPYGFGVVGGELDLYAGGTKTTKFLNSGHVQVLNGLAIGSNFNSFNPPTNGLIVEGWVGLGKNIPTVALDVVGDIRASLTTGSTNGYLSGTWTNRFFTPSNAPTAGQVLTAVGTAGHTAWSNAASGGSQTPWTSDIQASSNSLYEVKYIYGSSNVAQLLLGASPILGDVSISLFNTNDSTSGAQYYSPNYGHTFTGPVSFGSSITSATIHASSALTTPSATITTANIQTNNVTFMRTTNFFIGSNAISAWPTVPDHYGDAYWGNSNGVIYLLTATNISSLTWTATNRIAP